MTQSYTHFDIRRDYNIDYDDDDDLSISSDDDSDNIFDDPLDEVDLSKHKNMHDAIDENGEEHGLEI